MCQELSWVARKDRRLFQDGRSGIFVLELRYDTHGSWTTIDNKTESGPKNYLLAFVDDGDGI